MQSQFLGLGGALDYGCLLKPDRAEPHLGDRQALQARIAHLEGQVRLGGAEPVWFEGGVWRGSRGYAL